MKERAERLFATKGHKLSEMEIEVLSKKKDIEVKEQARMHETARLEAHIQKYGINFVVISYQSCNVLLKKY